MSWGMLELSAYKAEENAQRRNYISSIIHDIKAGMKDYEEN